MSHDIGHRIEASSGSIGRRYWRVDEMGIPLSITIDSQTLVDQKTVTMREINEMSQIRVDVSRCTRRKFHPIISNKILFLI